MSVGLFSGGLTHWSRHEAIAQPFPRDFHWRFWPSLALKGLEFPSRPGVQRDAILTTILYRWWCWCVRSRLGKIHPALSCYKYPTVSFFGGDVVQKTISLASVGLEIARNPWCSRQKPWILFWTTWSCPVQVWTDPSLDCFFLLCELRPSQVSNNIKPPCFLMEGMERMEGMKGVERVEGVEGVEGMDGIHKKIER